VFWCATFFKELKYGVFLNRYMLVKICNKSNEQEIVNKFSILEN